MSNPYLTATKPEPVDWHTEAPCRDSPDAWFPDKAIDAEDAIAACNHCPFIKLCAQEALDIRAQYGVWAGVLLNPKYPVGNRRELQAVIDR